MACPSGEVAYRTRESSDGRLRIGPCEWQLAQTSLDRLVTPGCSRASVEKTSRPSRLNIRMRSIPCLSAITRMISYAAFRSSSSMACHVAPVILRES